jgi:hypothetical protein
VSIAFRGRNQRIELAASPEFVPFCEPILDKVEQLTRKGGRLMKSPIVQIVRHFMRVTDPQHMWGKGKEPKRLHACVHQIDLLLHDNPVDHFLHTRPVQQSQWTSQRQEDPCELKEAYDPRSFPVDEHNATALVAKRFPKYPFFLGPSISQHDDRMASEILPHEREIPFRASQVSRWWERCVGKEHQDIHE